MNEKKAIVIMAAGMGSRYGGPKQIDPVGPNGEILMDYSLYDARRAGFEKLVFIVNRRIKSDFMDAIGERIGKRFGEVLYAFQEIDSMGALPPLERKKPWGTGHAVLCAKEFIDGPFAVINADDYYGRHAFSTLYNELSLMKNEWCMVGYELKNTLTEHGHVARGICDVSADGTLKGITERVRIEKRPQGVAYTEDGGQSYIDLPENTTVSMNLFGFTPAVFTALEQRFPAFLNEDVKKDPMGAEFFLPYVVGDAINKGEISVRVLKSSDRWYGVTYREDKPVVKAAIHEMIRDGVYPERLWD